MNTLTTQQFLDYNSTPLHYDRGAGYVIKYELIQSMLKACNEYNYKHKISGSKSHFFKFTTFDNKLNQYVQHVFAFNGAFDVIEIIRRFETYPTIWRRAYYSNGFMKTGLHPIFKKTQSYCIVASNPKDGWLIMPEAVESKLKYDYFEYNNFQNISIYDDTVKYCGHDNESNLDMLDYIKFYRNHPMSEIPMKLKLYKLCMNKTALRKIENDKSFRKWLFAHRDECIGLSYATINSAYTTNPNGDVSEYDTFLKRKREFAKYLNVDNKRLYSLLLEHTKEDKLFTYLIENRINPSTYFDYIFACEWLQLDLSDTKVLFPRNFMEMHDRYVSQLLGKDRCNHQMLKVAEKYKNFEFSDEEYSLTIAKNKSELINESKVLHHCVGKLGYDRKQAEEQSLICFIRPISDLETPYCTLELDLTRIYVLQCFGKCNTILPEVKPFVNKWLKYIRMLMKNQEIQ